MATSLEPVKRKEMAISLKPEDIFEHKRSILVKSLDLEKTLLGEVLVENGLLSKDQLTCIMVKSITTYLTKSPSKFTMYYGRY